MSDKITELGYSFLLKDGHINQLNIAAFFHQNKIDYTMKTINVNYVNNVRAFDILISIHKLDDAMHFKLSFL